MTQTIYLALLNEGTPCWRPVEAKQRGDDVYLIVDSNLDEVWEFGTGELVRCRKQTLPSGQTELVAFQKASEN